MKPVYQTILIPPYGNCLQACIASILELQLDDVPNFAERMDCNEWKDSEWWDDYECFMSKFGLQPLGVEPLIPWTPKGWHLIIGESPRGPYDHIIVGYNGRSKHDPYPGGGCDLIGATSFEVFVALNPQVTEKSTIPRKET